MQLCRLNLLNLQVGNYRCDRASIVSVELEFELHIVLCLPDHPHEET